MTEKSTSFQIEGYPQITSCDKNNNNNNTNNITTIDNSTDQTSLVEQQNTYTKDTKIKRATIFGIIGLTFESIILPLLTIILTYFSMTTNFISDSNSQNKNRSLLMNFNDDFDELCYCIEEDNDIDDCDCEGFMKNSNNYSPSNYIWNQAIFIFAIITILYEIISIITLIIWLIYLFICKRFNNNYRPKSFMYIMSLGGIKLKSRFLLFIILFRIITFFLSWILIFLFKPIKCECDDDDDKIVYTDYYINTYQNSNAQSNTFISMLIYGFASFIDVITTFLVKYLVNNWTTFTDFAKSFL